MSTTKDALERKNSDPSGEFSETIDLSVTHTTYIEANELSEEHRQYLLARHGTLDLDPLPGPSDADPYNWSNSKVYIKFAYSFSQDLANEKYRKLQILSSLRFMLVCQHLQQQPLFQPTKTLQ